MQYKRGELSYSHAKGIYYRVFYFMRWFGLKDKLRNGFILFENYLLAACCLINAAAPVSYARVENKSTFIKHTAVEVF